jgi:hypothetical protein
MTILKKGVSAESVVEFTGGLALEQVQQLQTQQ